MRRLKLCCLVVALAAMMPNAGQAAAPGVDPPPVKWIKLINNTKKILYPVINSGARDVDEWLQSLFQTQLVGIKKNVYRTARNYRTYVIEDQGMAPGTTLYVQVPFFSQLVARPDPTKNDQYIDWWNGGRVLFYDDKAQIEADYTSADQTLLSPVTAALTWCRTLNANQTACQNPRKLKVFSAIVGLPALDSAQLTEYTFADAVTANGAPYPLFTNKVGYNISSVDQVYFPIAMEPLGNPTIPYIGTVLGVAEFRAKMDGFLTAFPGWPVYLPGNADRPRIPGAYNVFASEVDLTPPGAAVGAMKTLYRKCNTASPPDQTAVCTAYRKVVDMLDKNYKLYEKLACYDPNVKFDEEQIIRRVYGWVPFNTKKPGGLVAPCPFNSLADTIGAGPLAALQDEYITEMQQSTTDPLFNPFFQLIHSSKYLDMAAYAFSIDDAVGFQSYVGSGIILSAGGSDGLDNKTKLDIRDRVTVTLGAPAKDKPQWGAFGICSAKPDYGQFEGGFWSVAFFPPKYPCRFTASDTAGNLFQFKIDSGPQSQNGLRVSCPANVSNTRWCASAYVPTPQQINAAEPLR